MTNLNHKHITVTLEIIIVLEYNKVKCANQQMYQQIKIFWSSCKKHSVKRDFSF